MTITWLKHYNILCFQGYLENRISSLFGSLEVLSANIASKASEILSRRRTVKTKYASLPASISAASSNIG